MNYRSSKSSRSDFLKLKFLFFFRLHAEFWILNIILRAGGKFSKFLDLDFTENPFLKLNVKCAVYTVIFFSLINGNLLPWPQYFTCFSSYEQRVWSPLDFNESAHEWGKVVRHRCLQMCFCALGTITLFVHQQNFWNVLTGKTDLHMCLTYCEIFARKFFLFYDLRVLT